MLNSFLINDDYVVGGALIFLRLTAFIFSSAVFSSTNISPQVKVLFCVVISLLLYPTQFAVIKSAPHLADQVIPLSVQAITVGLIIGLATRFFFFTVGMAGDLISMSIGLNSAQQFNPMSGTQSNLIEQFQMILATLVFFALQGHHFFISSLAQSFDVFPIVGKSLRFENLVDVAALGGTLFEIATKIAAPVMVTILLVNVTLGILGRAVPQLNVMMTSFAVTLSVGMLVLFVTLPLMVFEMQSILETTGQFVFKLMRNI